MVVLSRQDRNAFIKSHVPGHLKESGLERHVWRVVGGWALWRAHGFCIEAVHMAHFAHNCKKRKGFIKSE